MIFPEQGMAQPTLNCNAGSMPPNTSVLSQHSSWQEFSDSLALLVCNYQVGSEGGGSNTAGFAINVEYRCPAETADTWEGITFDHGDEEVARGPNFLHLSKTGSFTSYAGQFPIRERYWWLLDSQTIVKIILMTNGSVEVTSLLDAGSALAGANQPSARTCSQPGGGNNPPVINSLNTSNTTLEVGEEVTISVNATDPDGNALSYKWWLNGSLTSASTPNVTFTPSEAGSFTIKVEVSDGNGGTDSEEITLETEECPTPSSVAWQPRPQAVSCPGAFSVTVTVSSPAETGESILIAARVEGAQKLDQVSYQWFLNGDELNANSPALRWIAQEGNWTARVVAKEGSKQAEASINFNVSLVTVFLSQSPANPKEGETVTFTATVSGGVGELSYVWFADGQSTSATASSIIWQNASPGRHSVTVVVTDSEGREGRSGIDFSVEGTEPQGEGAQLLVNGQPLNPGETKTITLSEGEQIELKLKCEQLQGAIAIAVLRYTVNIREGDDPDNEVRAFALFDVFWRQGGADVLRALAICDKLSAGTSASVGLIPLQQTSSPTIGVNLMQGGVQFDLKQEGVAMEVETDTTTVSASDHDAFRVIHDPDAQESVVVADEGAVSVQPHATGAAPVTLQAGRQVAVDANGSGPITSVDRPGSPGPGGGATIAQALDVNGNNLIDDAEARSAIQLWIFGQPVPGTSQTIDDATIGRLIKMWILGEPVSGSPAGAASLQGIRASLFQLSAPSLLERTLRVQGQGIAQVQLQVFDLSGRLVLAEQSPGPALRFSLLNAQGQPLANGVYLYVVVAEGFDSQRWRSDVRKLVVLN